MFNNSVARVYARAVFDISLEYNNINQWKLILKLFSRVSADNLVRSLFSRFLESKRISDMFIIICEDIQKKPIDILAKNFIRIMSEKYRLSLLPMVFEEFNYLCAVYYTHILKVEVISAWPLNKDQIKKISIVMTTRFLKKVDIVNTINKNIFAGLIIRVGDVVIDGSINKRLLLLKNHILQ